MHVDAVDVHRRIFYNTKDMRDLVDGNSKFRVDMPHRDIGIPSCHNVWVDSDANRYVWISASELL